MDPAPVNTGTYPVVPVPVTVLGAEMLTDPLEPVAIVMLVPAMRYEVPSVSFVREPLNPLAAYSVPLTNTSPPKTDLPVLEGPVDPDTNKKTSLPVVMEAEPLLRITLPAVPVPAEGMFPADMVILPACAVAAVEVVVPAERDILPAVETVVESPAVRLTSPPGELDPDPFPPDMVTLPPPTELPPAAPETEIPFPVCVVPLVDPFMDNAEVVLFEETFVML